MSPSDSEPRTGAAASECLVALVDIMHRYGNTVALRDARLDISPGEVHGLVGENGSGKSTVVKILSGIVNPTQGELRINGDAVRLASPRDAQANGIVTVFQETLIAEENTAIENIFLGTDEQVRRARSHGQERDLAREVLDSLGTPVEILERPVHSLSIAQRQVLTLARALVRPWKLLVLDESTSALDIETRDRLFEIIRARRDEGRSVLFVSHRMDELELLIDRATVQRSGVTVGVLKKSEATPQRLVELMSGGGPEVSATAGSSPRRAIKDLGHSPTQEHTRSREIAIECHSVQLRPAATAFDLQVRRGEILGIAGLEGQGASELVEALVGLRRPTSGVVEIVASARGKGVSRLRSYREAFRQGVAYVPAKRQEEGLFGPMSVRDNLMISVLSRFTTLGFFRQATVDAKAQEYIDKLSVHPDDLRYPISGLSGGNAQKVLIARWLASDPKVLVLNDPLRGVDIGTKRQFYALLRELADSGVAVVLLSTEIEELLVASDRIAICRASTVSRVLQHAEREYDVVLAGMFGVSAMPTQVVNGAHS
ncbi:sugar ABC transporter ATP-binding protein [Sphaerisporangium sp. NPDC051011]|uniref:sugar ABC transporter ATP-binding protein n=1 Tax=Sphaerisporangium sp. NPDC051011 TaxID=3155792 RepID=UPI00340C0F84